MDCVECKAKTKKNVHNENLTHVLIHIHEAKCQIIKYRKCNAEYNDRTQRFSIGGCQGSCDKWTSRNAFVNKRNELHERYAWFTYHVAISSHSIFHSQWHCKQILIDIDRQRNMQQSFYIDEILNGRSIKIRWAIGGDAALTQRNWECNTLTAMQCALIE